MINRDTILIVDDIEMNRTILRGIFEKRYRLLEAEDGAQALELMRENRGRIAVVLLDIVMPVMDGNQVLQEMNRKGYISEMPVIIITAESAAETEIQAFDSGASDVITKPFEAGVVRRRVQNIIELHLRKFHQDELIEEQASKLRRSNAAIVETLASIIETRSLETGLHIKRICTYVGALLSDVAQNNPEYLLDNRRIEIITSAASLHDIGKIGIPDGILNKPGALTPEERKIMQTHTLKGCDMLTKLVDIADPEYLQYAYNICRYHHERWDGAGYPEGLKGDAIPICAQVVGVADCFDALTTDRVYKKAIPPRRALDMILAGECGRFSPKIRESLMRLSDTFTKYSLEYADSPRLAESAPAPASEVEPAREDPREDTLRYHALLKYINATVMEVDMATGDYRVVYQYSADFSPLRAGENFGESMRLFAAECVHPDDRERVLDILGDYGESFFTEGLLQRRRVYRIYDRTTKEYCPWQAAMLRINPDNPQQQKVILVWRQLEKTDVPARFETVVEKTILRNMIVDVQRFRNDRYFTMPEVSQGLADLLGYSRQELEEKFHNRYIELIHPADREEVLHLASEQRKEGSFQEMEYRVVTRAGRQVWLLEKSQAVGGEDGAEYFCCVLIDVTQSKQQQEELHRMSEQYQIFMEQTEDVIFEWNAASDILTFSPAWSEKFGHRAVFRNTMRDRRPLSYIHPDDRQKFDDMWDQLRRGKKYAKAEVRAADSSGHYRWCKLRITAVRSHAGAMESAIGFISDISTEKKETEMFREMAERDSLTRLFNKQTAGQKIDAYIEQMAPEEKAAMLIIDVDNFKEVNDQFGHTNGDRLLQRIGAALNAIFRQGDVVARVGGDEFMVFMENIRGRESAEDRAGKINERIAALAPDSGAGDISCSIGIAMCPDGGQSFGELFIHSDIALYYAKSKGKNRFAFYEEEMKGIFFRMTDSRVATGTLIDSDLNKE